MHAGNEGQITPRRSPGRIAVGIVGLFLLFFAIIAGFTGFVTVLRVVFDKIFSF